MRTGETECEVIYRKRLTSSSSEIKWIKLPFFLLFACFFWMLPYWIQMVQVSLSHFYGKPLSPTSGQLVESPKLYHLKAGLGEFVNQKFWTYDERPRCFYWGIWLVHGPCTMSTSRPRYCRTPSHLETRSEESNDLCKSLSACR